MENVALSDRMIDASADGVTAKEADAAFERTEPVGVDVAAETDMSAVVDELPEKVADRLCVEVPVAVEESVVVDVTQDDEVYDCEALPEELAVTEGEAVVDAELDALVVYVSCAVSEIVACPDELAVAVETVVELRAADVVAVPEFEYDRNVGSVEAEASFERTVPDGVFDAAEKVAPEDCADEIVATDVIEDELAEVAVSNGLGDGEDKIDGEVD